MQNISCSGSRISTSFSTIIPPPYTNFALFFLTFLTTHDQWSWETARRAARTVYALHLSTVFIIASHTGKMWYDGCQRYSTEHI
jgi:hypothetical protein